MLAVLTIITSKTLPAQSAEQIIKKHIKGIGGIREINKKHGIYAVETCESKAQKLRGAAWGGDKAEYIVDESIDGIEC